MTGYLSLCAQMICAWHSKHKDQVCRLLMTLIETYCKWSFMGLWDLVHKGFTCVLFKRTIWNHKTESWIISCALLLDPRTMHSLFFNNNDFVVNLLIIKVSIINTYHKNENIESLVTVSIQLHGCYHPYNCSIHSLTVQHITW